ncbi:neurophysin 1-like [Rhynchophorus ferrugineus]|uniref:Uncharacterized protein n=1 Tax=Rhynchophorus ferrugineus TaxID=354439 RepID=A0A834IRW6_RHYFE|nr:hypothetical protein GWI33_008004 [Rhynchophorus ferrugineus]
MAIFKNSKIIINFLVFVVFVNVIVTGCLITNCPRGGKRSGKFPLIERSNVKQCISCGPGNSGKCFGPSICCGPFGCLMGTPETIKCQRDGFFHEKEPCIAGTSNCRKNTGRCALDGICCSQESCHMDKQCSMDEKNANILPIDLINMLGYAADGGFDN